MKPMLAGGKNAQEVLASLKYPVFASPKLDGIRGFSRDGVVTSRNLLPLANELLQETFGWSKYLDYDGEFIAGDPTDKKVFSKTTSVVSSIRKPIDDLRYYVFDHIGNPNQPWVERYDQLVSDNLVIKLEHAEIRCEDDLLQYESEKLELGYEGLIVRKPDGKYKYGRSTLNEGYLLKLKRFSDDEAVVIGFEEKMHNANEKTLVKNGKPQRSSHQAGLVPLGTLGAIVVRWRDVEFNIGTGFDQTEAQEIWDNREKYLGKFVKFKYFDYGLVLAPRHPVFLGFREGFDLS
jgi:DNA ligase-1